MKIVVKRVPSPPEAPWRAWPLKSRTESGPCGHVSSTPSRQKGPARFATFAAIAAILVAMSQPASAHTREELDAWIEEWSTQAVELGESAAWVAEWVDVANRHSCQFDRADCHVYTATTVNRPAARVWNGNVEQWRPLVATYFRAEDVETAMRILACENTTGDPSVKNPNSSATGLFQHLGKYWADRSAAAGWAGYPRTDPVANVAVAAWLRDQRGGWNHWTCY